MCKSELVKKTDRKTRQSRGKLLEQKKIIVPEIV